MDTNTKTWSKSNEIIMNPIQQAGHVTYSWQTKSIQSSSKSFLIQVVNIQIDM